MLDNIKKNFVWKSQNKSPNISNRAYNCYFQFIRYIYWNFCSSYFFANKHIHFYYSLCMKKYSRMLCEKEWETEQWNLGWINAYLYMFNVFKAIHNIQRFKPPLLNIWAVYTSVKYCLFTVSAPDIFLTNYIFMKPVVGEFLLTLLTRILRVL